jgi:hypothetical protein
MDDERVQVFPYSAGVDVLFVDGKHRYWSTHCRHGRHYDCSATAIIGPGSTSIARTPAQCKTCAASCICYCHKLGSDPSATVAVMDNEVLGYIWVDSHGVKRVLDPTEVTVIRRDQVTAKNEESRQPPFIVDGKCRVCGTRVWEVLRKSIIIEGRGDSGERVFMQSEVVTLRPCGHEFDRSVGTKP